MMAMPKIPEIVSTYIAFQPESLQPALHEIHAMLAKAYPQAKVELYPTAKGEVPIYKDGETWLGGFAVRSKGPMVYVMDAEVVAKYKPQFGALADGKACVLYKPTKRLDQTALKALFTQMIAEAAAKKNK
jgi:uncharacterized protein YdhG (YjbR/CyaY superfamily)